MVDPGQAAIGIVVLLVAVGALLYIFYSRTNAVEKTGYGALLLLALISLMIPVFWILESNGEAVAKTQQHTTSVQRGAALFATYCFQCHGTKGQGFKGPQLNNNPTVNSLSDNDLLRIISGGIYDTTNPTTPLMPAWSEQYGGPLTNNDIQYLFDLVRSSDPAYLAKNGYPTGPGTNGFDQVPNDIQASNATAYQTAIAAESSGQFGTPVDMTKSKNVTINIVAPAPTGGQVCNPDCYTPINVKVKVGTVITWDNLSNLPHTVTAIQGTNPSVKTAAPQIFDSGAATPIVSNGKFTWTVTMAAYNLNPDHTVIYYCRIHPGMVAILTIVT